MIRWLGFTATAVLALPLLYLGLNLTDDPLDPQLGPILHRLEPVPQKAEDGHRLARELVETVLNTRETMMFLPVSASYLKQAEFQNVSKAVPRFLKDRANWFQLQDQLIDIGVFGTKFPEAESKPPPAKAWAPVLLEVWRARAVEINVLLRSGRSPQAIELLQKIFSLHLKSLDYPQPLVHTMTNVAVMRDIRLFVTDAARDFAPFAQALTPQIRESFRVDLDFNSLRERAMVWELGWIPYVHRQDPDVIAFVGSILGPSTNWLEINARHMTEAPLYYNKHRLQNALYFCWTHEGGTREITKLLYPGVAQLTDILCRQVSGRMLKIEKELGNLREPFPN